MQGVTGIINPSQVPHVIAETASFLVLYKPPRMHTAPLKKGEANTLLAWAASLFPNVLNIKGNKARTIEGGLVHRLDYETHGLVLIARSEAALAALRAQQEKNIFIKEYDAVSYPLFPAKLLPGFPPLPLPVKNMEKGTAGIIIESAFRPFGRGRIAVRPMLKGTPLYRTEILSCVQREGKEIFRLRLTKGFRHQIRCHLAWLNRPLLNDPLYNNNNRENDEENSKGSFLALRASSLAFTDPQTGNRLEYKLPY